MSNLVSIVPAETKHHNFIKSTWLKSFFLGRASFCENLSPETYYSEHGKLVEAAIATFESLVAQSIENPEVTIGYLVYDLPDTIHYVYVRHAFYKFGIAKELLRVAGVDLKKFNYSHRTRACGWSVGFTKRVDEGKGVFKRVFVEGKYPGGTYNPYSFLRGPL